MASAGRPQGLRVRTECATAEQFIAAFLKDCDESSVFAPTDRMLPEGSDCAFSLELADGQPMLRGLGVVLNAWPTSVNRFSRVGVHIGFVQLTSASAPILERLLAARTQEAGARRRVASQTQPRIAVTPADMSRWSDEESVVRDVRSTITHELRAESPPNDAAPVAIEDRSNQTVRYEGPLRAPAPPARRVDTAKNYPAPRSAAHTAGTQASPALPPIPRPLATPPPIPVAARGPIARGSVATAESPPITATAPDTSASTATEPVETSTSAAAAPTSESAADRFPRASTALERARRRVGSVIAPIRQRVAPHARQVRARIAPVMRRATSQGARWIEAASTPRWRTTRIAAIFGAGILVGLLISIWIRSAPSSAPVAANTTQSPVAMYGPQCTPALTLPAPAESPQPMNAEVMRTRVAIAEPNPLEEPRKPLVAIPAAAAPTPRSAKSSPPAASVTTGQPQTATSKPTTAAKPTTGPGPMAPATKPTIAAKPPTGPGPMAPATKPTIAAKPPTGPGPSAPPTKPTIASKPTSAAAPTNAKTTAVPKPATTTAAKAAPATAKPAPTTKQTAAKPMTSPPTSTTPTSRPSPMLAPATKRKCASLDCI